MKIKIILQTIQADISVQSLGSDNCKYAWGPPLPIRKMYILFWIGCEEDRGILKPTAT